MKCLDVCVNSPIWFHKKYMDNREENMYMYVDTGLKGLKWFFESCDMTLHGKSLFTVLS